jgi:hypothetical protein
MKLTSSVSIDTIEDCLKGADRVPVLFFSRGRGRGHAMTDLAIIESFPELSRQIELRFVSYGTGAQTFRDRGYSVIDMGLDDTAPFFEILLRATRIINDHKPAIVMAHEEFAVPIASRAFSCPSVFITDWFYPLGHILNEPLAYAESIIFINPPGIFAEPETVKGKVQYFGFVVRSMSYTKADKERARRELDISRDAVLISVVPGAWATEARAPLLEMLVPAFEALPYATKHLVWVAGDDTQAVCDGARSANISVLRTCWPTDRLLVASDLVVTKTNRGSIMEAASLGVRTLSVTYGLNPVDELLARHIHSGIVLNYRGINSAILSSYLEAELEHSLAQSASFVLRTADSSLVARALADQIRRCLGKSPASATA